MVEITDEMVKATVKALATKQMRSILHAAGAEWGEAQDVLISLFATAAISAVAPLIEAQARGEMGGQRIARLMLRVIELEAELAQARADAIEEAIVALNGIDGPSWHDDGSFGLAMERGEKAIRALLSPRPVSQGEAAE